MKSRYIRTVRNKIPKPRRSKTLYGSFEDSGKYIKCRICGWIVDTTRDLGSSEGTGNYSSDFPVPSEPIGCVDGDYSVAVAQSTLDTVRNGFIGTVIKNDSDGDPITVYYTPRQPSVTRGCPLCGCCSP